MIIKLFFHMVLSLKQDIFKTKLKAKYLGLNFGWWSRRSNSEKLRIRPNTLAFGRPLLKLKIITKFGDITFRLRKVVVSGSGLVAFVSGNVFLAGALSRSWVTVVAWGSCLITFTSCKKNQGIIFQFHIQTFPIIIFWKLNKTSAYTF